MKLAKSVLTFSIATIVLFGCVSNMDERSASEDFYDSKNIKRNIEIWPVLDIEVKQKPSEERRVKEILSQMTLEHKIAQMIQPEIRDITVADMRKYGFGSFLNGGGAFPNNNKHAIPQDWIKLAEDMYQASIDDSQDGSTIPTMWGTDAVHGHNNVIGATLFPHNIGLGAANNPALIKEIAKATATEVMVTGIDWVFAPTVATVRDDRWGRTYESYSEDPEIVRDYSKAIVHGLQGAFNDGFLGDDRVISTVKHFIGDGGTAGGDDQGNNIASEKELFAIHAQGYVGGLSAGAQSVMASFNSWHDEKVHGHKYLLNDVLKDRMGFDGFVVGDWNGHGQVQGCTNESCVKAVNAGLDMFMVPTNAWQPLYYNLINQVKEGLIPIERINDAVTRILRVKVRAGLFEKPSPANRELSGKVELIGKKSHRDIAKQAVRESLVLLKNKEGILPLSPNTKILVAGDAADNIGKQSGGWTITWQGTNNTNEDFPGGTSIYDGIKQQVENANGNVELSESGEYKIKPDVAVIVFGEDPYAEGHGDRAHVDYQRGKKSDLAILKKLQSENIPVVSIFITGRPLWMNAELNASDAFVVAWLPGSEGSAVAEVLFTDQDNNIQHDFTGQLSFSWPAEPYQATVNVKDEVYEPLLPFGFGLSYGDQNILSDSLPETYKVIQDEMVGRAIFSGSLQKPWTMQILSGYQQKGIAASTASLNNINYRTIDRNIQEDAFRLEISASEESKGIQIVSMSRFREDMFSQSNNESVLSFMVKLETSVSGPLILSLNCESVSDEEGSCRSQLDISEVVSQIPVNQWQKIRIDTKCMINQGIKFENMVVPFQLTSKENITLNISEIAFEFEMRKQADIVCQ